MSEELNKLVSDFREISEKNVAETAALQGNVKQLEADLIKSEAKTRESFLEKSALVEVNEKLVAIEKSIAVASLSKSGVSAQSEWKNAFMSYICKGDKVLGNAAVQKYLRTDVNVDGGYLVPEDYMKEILKNITEVSAIRRYARVRSTNSKAFKLPIRTQLVTASWIGEGEQDSLSNSQYGMNEVPMNKIQVTVPITIEELADTAFNMSSEISEDVAEAFSALEGVAFLNGDGVKKPSGFMVNATIGGITSGTAGAVDFDDMFDMTAEVKAAYNSIFGFNQNTLVTLLKEKSTTGQYLWQAGNLAANVPATIAGFRYDIFNDMADIAAGNYPVFFGDLGKGYIIGDHTSLTMIRDDYSRKRYGIVEFMFMKRTAGQVVKPEALARMLVKS